MTMKVESTQEEKAPRRKAAVLRNPKGRYKPLAGERIALESQQGAGMKRKLYNLTLHNQSELAICLADWEVEVEPRLVPVYNPQDWTQIKRIVRMSTTGIPIGSAALIGGMTQVALLISQLELFELFYIKLSYNKDKMRPTPSGICPHIKWTAKESNDIRKLVNV